MEVNNRLNCSDKLGIALGNKIIEEMKTKINFEEIKGCDYDCPPSVQDKLKKQFKSILQNMATTAEKKFTHIDQSNLEDMKNFFVPGFLGIFASIREEAKKWPPNVIVDCGVAEAAFSHAEDRKPIIATDALATCVGIAGYDADNQMGFVVHFSGEKEVEVSGEQLVKQMKQMQKQPITQPLQVHLRGGIKNLSEPLLEAINKWLESFGCLIQIVSREVLTEGLLDEKGYPHAMSLSLDTRTGQVSTYDSSTNLYAKPKKEIKSEEEAEKLVFDLFIQTAISKPKIRIIYPETKEPFNFSQV